MDALVDRHRAEYDTLKERAEHITNSAVSEARDLSPADESALDEITERMAYLGDKISKYAAVNEQTNRTAELLTQIHHDGENGLIRAEAPNALVDTYGGPQGAARYISDFLTRGEDPAANERITRVVANVITTQNPGVVPDPLVGSVITLGVDARMPIANSFVQNALNGRGPVFYRPRIKVHSQVGVQVKGGGVLPASSGAEKSELASRAFQTERVTVEVNTLGGVVDVSIQTTTFSNVDAIQAIVTDLVEQANIQAETIASGALVADATANASADTIAPAPTPQDVIAAIYAAAAKVYSTAKVLPTHVAMSVDVWAKLGSLTDTTGRPLFSAINSQNAAGTMSADSFSSGPWNGLIPVVSPALAANSLIVYYAPGAESWSQEIGTLSVVEPRLLGYEVAYGRFYAACITKPGISSLIGTA